GEREVLRGCGYRIRCAEHEVEGATHGRRPSQLARTIPVVHKGDSNRQRPRLVDTWRRVARRGHGEGVRYRSGESCTTRACKGGSLVQNERKGLCCRRANSILRRQGDG